MIKLSFNGSSVLSELNFSAPNYNSQIAGAVQRSGQMARDWHRPRQPSSLDAFVNSFWKFMPQEEAQSFTLETAHCLKTLKGLGAQARNPFLNLRMCGDKCSLHYLTRFGGVGPTLAKCIYWWSLNTMSALCCSPLLFKTVPSALDQKLPVFLFIWTQRICSFLRTHAIWEGIGKKRLGRSRVRQGVKVEGVQWGQNFLSSRIQSSFWTLPSVVWKGQLSWLNPSPSLLRRYSLCSFFCDKPMVMASGT